MSTTNTPSRGLDNRIKLRLNQEKVLVSLHRFGWLPVRQVHLACWPTEATPRNAQRYLAQLLELGQVQFKVGPDGSRVYALTLKGARRLRNELGLKATYDKDFAGRAMPSYHHRCLANEVAFAWTKLNGPAAGYYTEHEIAAGRAPVTSAPKLMSDPCGKVPDGLLTCEFAVDENNTYATWYGWVEVEYSDKPKPAHQHMVRALCDVIGYGKSPWEIGSAGAMQFAVVVCPHVRQEYKLVEGVLEFLSQNSQNYNVLRIVNNLNIWRPGAEEGIPLRMWMDDKPDMLALRHQLKLWWPALPKP